MTGARGHPGGQNAAQGAARDAERAAGRRAGRPSKAATVNDILDTASVLFCKQGYASTRVDDIADASNLSKPTLYSRIASKEVILSAIALRHHERLLMEAQAINEGKSQAFEKLEKIFTLHCMLTVERQSDFKVLLSEMRYLSDRTAIDALADGYVSLLRALLQRGVRSGRIRRDICLEVLLRSYLGLANWPGVWFKPSGGISARDVAAQAWALFARGCAP
jgi:AcrR family transcriptional regulator